jgi:inosine/xanthosine triphosphate pyrophosphatase family protein
LQRSAAQLPSDLKNRLSHRSQALAALLHQLAQQRW